MFKLGYTFWIIVTLVILLIASGLLYRHTYVQLAESREKVADLVAVVKTAQRANKDLQSSLELNASKSLQDNTEREELKMQVANLQQDLKKKIPLTKNKCPVSNGNAQVNDTDDIELSPELTGLLKSAYDKSTGNSSTTTSQPSK